jgi:D-alanine-D-alanine ligase
VPEEKKMRKLNIAVLYDAAEEAEKGKSRGKKRPEAYRQVESALKKRGHHVELIPASPDIRKLVSQIEKSRSEIIFNVCEALGEISQHEQHVAALLELLRKRYTGSAPHALAMAQDKELSKKLFAYSGLKYPKYAVMNAGKVEWADDLEFPVFIKPLDQDASIGIDNRSVAYNIKDMMERISFIHTELGSPALIEEFIEGREIYVGVLGNEKPAPLPILEWDFSSVADGVPKIASSEAKWDETSEYKNSPEIFPEDIPENIRGEIQEAALTAYKLLKLHDYGRIDLRVRVNPKKKSWEYYIIEVNPNPHLDIESELPIAARKIGMDYPDLIERIVELALERNGLISE